MSELVQQVQAELLSAKGLDAADISGAIDQMLGRNVDYGEVYIQSGRSESFGLEDGIVKDGSFAVDAGLTLYKYHIDHKIILMLAYFPLITSSSFFHSTFRFSFLLSVSSKYLANGSFTFSLISLAKGLAPI